MRWYRKRSLAYLRAPREAWMITGDSVSRAASMIACTCSRLLTLNAPTPYPPLAASSRSWRIVTSAIPVTLLSRSFGSHHTGESGNYRRFCPSDQRSTASGVHTASPDSRQIVRPCPYLSYRLPSGKVAPLKEAALCAVDPG